jgi:CheY-like chemotaxis protein
MRKRNSVHTTIEGLSGSLIPAKELKIFIVDDDEFFLKLITSCLSKFTDFTIYEFSSYEDCLKSKVKPDIAILDYYIGTDNNDRTNGVKVLGQLREKYPNILGFVLSGKAELASENEKLKHLLDTNFSELRKKFRDGSYFYFYKNKASCFEIFDILSKISWKSAGE